TWIWNWTRAGQGHGKIPHEKVDWERGKMMKQRWVAVAKDADVDRLVLTHWWKGEKGIEKKLVQQARKIFDGKVILARDLLSVDI
ncbi:MAG: hypothetical protein ACFE7A_06155, partial [Promethearchaeota archaeon]